MKVWYWEVADKGTGEVMQSGNKCISSLVALYSAIRFIIKVRLKELLNDTYRISIYDEPPDSSTRVPINRYEFRRV